jgi:hypothetical protein
MSGSSNQFNALVSVKNYPYGIAVGPSPSGTPYVFYATAPRCGTPAIEEVAPDHSITQVETTGSSGSFGVAFDSSDNELYYSTSSGLKSSSQQCIDKVSFNNGGAFSTSPVGDPQSVYCWTSDAYVLQLAEDPNTQMLFWNNSSEVEALPTGGGSPSAITSDEYGGWGVAVNPATATVYWTQGNASDPKYQPTLSYAPEPGHSGGSGNLFKGAAVAGEEGTNFPMTVALNPGSGTVYWSADEIPGVFYGSLSGGSTYQAGANRKTYTVGVGVVQTQPAAGVTSSDFSPEVGHGLGLPLSCSSAGGPCTGYLEFELRGDRSRVPFSMAPFETTTIDLQGSLISEACRQLGDHQVLRIAVVTTHRGGSVRYMRSMDEALSCQTARG